MRQNRDFAVPGLTVSSKSWTYKQLTDSAEQRMIRLRERAIANPTSAHLMQQWAYGAYSFWAERTSGWQNEGDDRRLEALTENFDQPDPANPKGHS